MKKIIAIIICLFVFPVIVHADMAAPGSYEYEVIVTNPNGIKVKNQYEENASEITIPYNTKLVVYWESKQDGYVLLGVEYNDKHFEVSSKDVMVFSKEIDFSKLQKNESEIKYLVIKDVPMYNGPSTLYGKVENVTIPKDTQLNFEYCVDSDALSWIYTEYNGTKGWVNVYTAYENEIYTATINKEAQTLFVAQDLTIYKNLDNIVKYYQDDELNKMESVGTVKAGNMVTFQYETMILAKINVVYVTVNGVSGWVIRDLNSWGSTLVEEWPGEVFVTNKDGVSVYANYNDTTPVSGITIPYLTRLAYTYEIYLDAESGYYYNVRYKVKYNGKEYWVRGNQNDFSNYRDEEITLTLKTDTSLYKYSNKTDTHDNVFIKQGETLTYISEKYDYEEVNVEAHEYPKKSYYLVEYNGILGWIHSDDVEGFTTPDVTPEEPNSDEEEIVESPRSNSLTSKQIALICGGAAIVLAATAIVTIVLINKKKNNTKTQPSDATIQHKELVKLLDEALEKDKDKK